MIADARVVLVTAPSKEKAAEISAVLVSERLAACVNILPVALSVYFWNNAVQQEPEVLMIIKTGASLVTSLEKRVYELHPYTVPEFVVISPEYVGPRYLEWMMECLTPHHSCDRS